MHRAGRPCRRITICTAEFLACEGDTGSLLAGRVAVFNDRESQRALADIVPPTRREIQIEMQRGE